MAAHVRAPAKTRARRRRRRPGMVIPAEIVVRKFLIPRVAVQIPVLVGQLPGPLFGGLAEGDTGKPGLVVRVEGDVVEVFAEALDRERALVERATVKCVSDG